MKTKSQKKSRIEFFPLYRHDRSTPCTDRYIAPLIVRLCKKHHVKKVLDIGCGNGCLCRALADCGLDVVGIEPGEEGVDAARHLVPEGSFHEKSVYDDPGEVPEAEFDAVVSTEVVEHLFYPRALPLFAREKLREGGLLIVSTPYHGYLKNLAISLRDGWDTHHTTLWDGGHIKFWSRKTLTSLLESNGFEVVAFQGVGRFPLLWKSMVLVARIKQQGGGRKRDDG